MAERDTLPIFTEVFKIGAFLSNEQFGELIRAYYDYSDTGAVYEGDPVIRMAFGFLASQLDRYDSHAEKVSQKRKAAIEKRWADKQAETSTTIQTDTKAYKSIQNDTNANKPIQTIHPIQSYPIQSNPIQSNPNIDIEADASPAHPPEKKKQSKGIFQEFAGDDAELLAALKDFNEMRNRKKAPMTDAAKERLVARLKTMFGDDRVGMIEAIQNSTDHGWTDVYDKRKQKTQQPTQPAQGSFGGTEERKSIGSLQAFLDEIRDA